MTYKEFQDKLTKAFGDRVKNVYFAQNTFAYYADYRPKYPERSAGDFLITYTHFDDRTVLSADTVCVPNRNVVDFETLLKDISNMDY